MPTSDKAERVRRFLALVDAMGAAEDLLAVVETRAVETAAALATAGDPRDEEFTASLAGVVASVRENRARLAGARSTALAAIARAQGPGPRD